MKVSKAWLKELVDLKISEEELVNLLPLRTIALSENTSDFLELDMKGYNRADLLSMRGVAYEVAAITDSKVKFIEPDPSSFTWIGEPNYTEAQHLNVQVEDQNLAPVYCLAKIEGLKVGPSDQDWIQKLLASGMRSVNNVADVTNLVMLEYGQPLHAFDASQVKDETIIVRPAREGEKLRTLDDKDRSLDKSMLLITDPEKVLGIAGVMGGKNSEITDQTTTILLEAAIFDPASLRKTSNLLGLTSEASKRFYHGLTKKRLFQAFNAAIKMYQEMGGKLKAVSLSGDLTDPEKQIKLTAKKTNSLIGTEILNQQIEEYLNKLNFSLISQTREIASDMPRDKGFSSWEVTPPYWRLDVNIEEDLIEEVARMYGYENIPAKELEGELPAKIDQSLFELIYKLKTSLAREDYTEIQTYSYFSTKVLKNFGWLEMQNQFPLIKIANPISAETEYLRHNLWSNLVEKAGENLKFFEQVAIFEVGKTYEVVNGKIHEEYRLAMLLVDGTDNPLAQLNSTFQSVISQTPEMASDMPRDKESLKLGDKVSNPPENELFHPNRSAMLILNSKVVGCIAEIHPRITERFGIGKRIAIAEIKIQTPG